MCMHEIGEGKGARQTMTRSRIEGQKDRAMVQQNRERE